MPLWIDSNRPKSFSELDFGQEKANRLQNLVKKGNFPHLMFYGPPGSGKKTRVLCLLKELYGNGALQMNMGKMTFMTPSNKNMDIQILSSNYHIELNPSDVGIYDRVVIMDLIKQVAQTHQISPSTQHEFKVIILTSVDNLSIEAQHALRRTMEKYVETCRLILIANSLSKVIEAINSRCLCIRCPAPTHQELVRILKKVADSQSVTVSNEMLIKIANKSNRNIRRAVLMLETCFAQSAGYDIDPKMEIVEPDWLVHLKYIADKIVSNQSMQTLQGIRNHLYEQIVHCIPPHIIFEHLLKYIVTKTDIYLAEKVFDLASLYEHRLSHGSKAIFHLEAFVAEVMSVFKQSFDENMDF